MRKLLFLFVLLIFGVFGAQAQSTAQKIYETEKAFEKAAAEKGINQAFSDFSARDGVCLFPGYPVNCIEYFQTAKSSTAALLWNPRVIDVSSNGALAYSTGNSIYKPNGKDDPNAFYGEYATVWQRQPDGNYRAVYDIGIGHEKPAKIETDWQTPADSGKELNEKKSSAADASTVFYETATKQSLGKAYKNFLAEDARILREGKMPMIGKNAAVKEAETLKGQILLARRSVFVGAADMAYVSSTYKINDRTGKLTETGNFLQVWKLRGGKWQIVFDVFAPAAK